MSYPSHEFSQFIDNTFSYNNKVNTKTNKNTLDISCNDNLTLEPRLQEFINKKKYYKQYNIKPPVSLEQQYYITNEDKHIILKFIRGNKNIYPNTY